MLLHSEDIISDCQSSILPLRKQEDTIIHHKLSKDSKQCRDIYYLLGELYQKRKSILEHYLGINREHMGSASDSERSRLLKEESWLKSQVQVEEIIHTDSIRSWRKICGNLYNPQVDQER
jgi:hypothetical protein